MTGGVRHLFALAAVLAAPTFLHAEVPPDTMAYDRTASGKSILRRDATTATGWDDLPAYRHEGVSPWRLTLALTGVAVYDIGFYETLKKPWWSGAKSDFHVINDWWGGYSMEVDKLAHAYAGQSLALIAAGSYEWSGMTRRQSLFWGGVTSLATLSQVEVLDGYTQKFGFSTADYAANVAGAFFPLAQEVWKPLGVVTFKMSWHPRRFEDTAYDYHPAPPNLLEDYDRQTYWLAFDINALLPRNARPYWPDWLGLAVGYGVKNSFAARKEDRVREYYLALDFDPTRARVGNGWTARLLAPLHYWHLPAPAIRFREDGTTLFALYF